MLFSSFEFLFLFLPIATLAVALARPLGRKTSLAAIVAASLYFYGWFYPPYLLLLILSIGFNYVSGQRLRRKRKGRLLFAAVAFNVLLLVVFKYTDLILATINWSFSTELPDLGILLPLAISFFTFQQIAYVVDCYHGTAHRNNLLEYTAFVTFFPQLIAGPIVRQQHVMPALTRDGVRVHLNGVGVGLSLFLLGLAKKVVLADHFATIADPIFLANAQGEALSAIDAWIGLLAYTLQIYFDFSAYSDMAIGLGLMFGLNLPINFFSPYKASSITEFWRRWHISLSLFLRDYIYIPLGGNRLGQLLRYRNLMLVMLIGGIWHGADWAFLLWGALHGAYLVTNHLSDHVSRRLSSPMYDQLLEFFAPVLTFSAVILAWVPFRANGLEWISFYGALFSGAGPITHGGGVPMVIFGLFVIWALPNLMQVFDYMKHAPVPIGVQPVAPHLTWSPQWRWVLGITAAFVLSTLLVLDGEPNAFIYFQF